MIQSLFIINKDGDVIIEKHWKGIVSRLVCEQFWTEVSKAPSPEEVLPVIATSKSYLVHIQNAGLYYLCCLSSEAPILLILDFLKRVVEIFEDYFGELSEETLKDNFITVYQLLDELLDNGVPFNTEPNVLKELINPPNLLRRVANTVTGGSSLGAALPVGSLSNIPWRKANVKYATNEIYFDIVEEIDCIIDPNGLVVTSEVSGQVLVNCKLSGMPDLTLNLQNPRSFDDVSFHPCVRYVRYEHDKVISFIPPDGHFKLMDYRCTSQLQLPLYVKPQITFSEGTGKVSVMTGPKNTNGKAIESMVIHIPFPKWVSSTDLSATFGSVQFDELTKICRWEIGKLPKEKSPLLTGTVSFPPGSEMPEGNPILTVDFKIVMFGASGIKVESVSIVGENYKPYKGVRLITKAGKFQIRS